MARKSNVWIGVRPLDPEPFHDLREELSSILPEPYHPETDPHVTVLQCNLPTTQLDNLEEQARRTGLLGQTFDVDGFRCHPSADDPEVVLLDADIDLAEERSVLGDFVRERGGEVLTDPAPPHVTLWKRDWDASMDDETCQRLAECMADLHDRASWEARIGDVDVNTF